MRRVGFRWLVVGVLSFVLVGISIWVWRHGSSAGLGLLWAVIPSGLAVLSPFVAWALRTHTPSVQARRDLLRDALDELALASATRWQTEEATRGTLDPWPLPVEWTTTGRARGVMVDWAAVRGIPDDDAPIVVSGRYTEIADVFTAPDSPRRLVILGRPGAGKSTLAIRLVLDLLDRRGADDAVPVLLPVATWDPAAQHIRAWIAQQLASAYPALGARSDPDRGPGHTVARTLVEEARILPVLDGLDELPAGLRGAAISALGRGLRRQDQLVVTCRVEEYQSAVADDGPLAGTIAVELAPLRSADVARYLVAGTAGPPARWQPIRAELRAHPDGVLASALSTPLMAWLARTVYRSPATRPAELLADKLARNPVAIEKHLLDGLVPAIYRDRSDADHGHPQWTATQARGWLRFLARQLMADRSYDITWWRMVRAMTARASDPVLALIGMLVLGLLFAGGVTVGLGHIGRGLWLCGLAALLASGPLLGSLSPYGTWPRAGRSLTFHRHSAIVQGIVVTALIDTGAQAEPVSGHRYDLPQALLHGLLPGLLGGFLWLVLFNRWALWSLLRCFLALTRRLPWRLSAFLVDAWRRGVLRRVGQAYQFRHLRLQERLGRTTGPEPPSRVRGRVP